MGVNFSENIDYSFILLSTESIHHGLTLIQGEFRLKHRRKIRVEKEIRIDLIGRLTDKTKQSRIFFTFSSPLITSHENGTARTIRRKDRTFPFRIPLGTNLPPSCQFDEFSIDYHLEIHHDGQVVSTGDKINIFLRPKPFDNVEIYQKTIDVNGVTVDVNLSKNFSSLRIQQKIPVEIFIKNPKEKSIRNLKIELIQIVSLNDEKYEKHLVSAELFSLKIDKEIQQIFQLDFPSNLPSSYVPNLITELDSIPSIGIIYEIRLEGQIQDFHLQFSIPIIFK